MIEYHIIVNNCWASSALDVIVTDTLPTALITSSVLMTSSLGTCSLNGSLASCQLGDLPFGITDTVWITLTAQVDLPHRWAR